MLQALWPSSLKIQRPWMSNKVVRLQSHPVRVCKVPQRPGLHLAVPADSPSQPVNLLAVQPLHVELWSTGAASQSGGKQVGFINPVVFRVPCFLGTPTAV